MSFPAKKDCPCSSGQPYGRCCGVYHSGSPDPDLESLVRARYCAYALTKVGFVMATTHPQGSQFREQASSWRRAIETFCKGTRFRGLEILEVVVDAQGEQGEQGVVTFHATLLAGDEDVSFTEKSVFRRHEGRWKYFSAEHL